MEENKNPLFIINQDRDECVPFNRNTDIISVETNKQQGQLWGFNLYVNKTVIGTFDSQEEAYAEQVKLAVYDKLYFVVSGYDDYIVD
jgi:hypothetical protein